jgi:hypothetical protein
MEKVPIAGKKMLRVLEGKTEGPKSKVGKFQM